jgi:hypothetical protein
MATIRGIVRFEVSSRSKSIPGRGLADPDRLAVRIELMV